MSATLAMLVRLELAKTARAPMTWWLGLITLAFLALLGFALVVAATSPPQAGVSSDLVLGPMREAGVEYGVRLFMGVAVVTIIVLAGQTAGAEFSRGTLRTWLLNGAGRAQTALAKMASLLVVALVAGIAGALLAVALTASLGAAVGEDFLARSTTSDLALLPLRAAATLGAWAVLACCVTLVTRSPAAGIGSTLGVAIVGDVITSFIAQLGEVGELARRALPNWAISRISDPDLATVPIAEWSWIVGGLAFWIGGAAALAVWRMRRLNALAATR